MDKTGQAIVSKLFQFGQCKSIYLQWTPSHVGVYGNETDDDLAKKGCDLPTLTSTDLCPTEIHSYYKHKYNMTWKISSVHQWYFAEQPGLSLLSKRSRPIQTAMARFRSGHLRCMKFKEGEKTFPSCACFLPASSAHLLDCICVSLRQLSAEQDDVSDFLVWQGLLDLV
ncbi:hypothetical protein X975_13798, partial [Stegodyphus mimosarum]